jgi:hypothetical protein
MILAAGGVNIVVTNPDGQSGTLASSFIYHSADGSTRSARREPLHADISTA